MANTNVHTCFPDPYFFIGHIESLKVEREFVIAIKGFYTDLNVDKIDSKEGIYFVVVARPDKDGNLLPDRIIYIGQGIRMKERLSNHDKHDEFLAQCDKKVGDQVVYYSGRTGALSPEHLDWCEAAVISEYEDLPTGVSLINDQHKDNYGYKTARVKLYFAADSKHAGKKLPDVFQYTEFIVYQDVEDAKPKAVRE
jgi:hypothetical protein